MEINNSECGICESCIEVCPLGIIKKKGYKVVIQEECDKCGECIEVCPVGAIQIEDDE
jgi:Fe-S-cluster-containing hydrogenase component 2